MSIVQNNSASLAGRRPATPVSAASLSGRHWVIRFPGSIATRDLKVPFRSGVEAFISALRTSGAKVAISSTLRDPKRAYLMHWSWRIVKQNYDPADVPPMDGVDIVWVHKASNGQYSRPASVAAAREMVNGFQIQSLDVAPALKSRHTLGYAIDMNVSWSGTLSLPDAYGGITEISTLPRTGLNVQLRRAGESYGVIKYNRAGRDDPHWSDNGA